MFARYIGDFFIGALVGRRILLWGLPAGAFVLTLGFSSRYDRRSDAAPSIRAATQPHEAMAQTREAAPTAAAMNPPPAIAPPEPVQNEPYSIPVVGNGEMENAKMRARTDRAAAHGSRTR